MNTKKIEQAQILVPNPCLLAGASTLALTKQTHPRCQQPSGNKPADANIEYLPNDQRYHSICRGIAHDGIRGCEKKEVQPSNEQEPAEWNKVAANKFPMRTKRGMQGFVMQN